MDYRYWVRLGYLDMQFIHCFGVCRPQENVGTSCSYSFGILFRAQFASFNIHAFLLAFFSDTISNFIFTAPMRLCCGLHSCMSFKFFIALLNKTCSSLCEIATSPGSRVLLDQTPKQTNLYRFCLF